MRLRDTNRGGGGGRRAVGRGCGAPPATSTHPQGGDQRDLGACPGLSPRWGQCCHLPAVTAPRPQTTAPPQHPWGLGGDPPRFSPAVDNPCRPLSAKIWGAATREFARLSLPPRHAQGSAWVLGWGLHFLPCPPPLKKVNLGRAERARPVRDTCCRGRAAPPAAPCSGPRTPPGLC